MPFLIIFGIGTIFGSLLSGFICLYSSYSIERILKERISSLENFIDEMTASNYNEDENEIEDESFDELNRFETDN